MAAERAPVTDPAPAPGAAPASGSEFSPAIPPPLATQREDDRAARLVALAAQLATVFSARPAAAQALTATAPVTTSRTASTRKAGTATAADAEAADPEENAAEADGVDLRLLMEIDGDDPDGHAKAPLTGEARAAMNTCLRMLTAAAQPRSRLEQALRRREVPDDVITTVLGRLERGGLIDDAAYAAAYVRTKSRDRSLARTGLRRELTRIGVDPETTASAVAQLDDEQERSAAEAIVTRKLPAALRSGEQAARRRMLGVLARRGYPADLAFSVVDRALADASAAGNVPD